MTRSGSGQTCSVCILGGPCIHRPPRVHTRLHGTPCGNTEQCLHGATRPVFYTASCCCMKHGGLNTELVLLLGTPRCEHCLVCLRSSRPACTRCLVTPFLLALPYFPPTVVTSLEGHGVSGAKALLPATQKHTLLYTCCCLVLTLHCVYTIVLVQLHGPCLHRRVLHGGIQTIVHLQGHL